MKYISKKKLLSLFSALFILGSVFVLFSDASPLKSTFVFEKSKSRNNAEKALTTIVIKDSDGDGLRDWEEALWKTDPKNADSDGDGTLDGEEVREGRDPTKPGPKDKIEPADKYKQEILKEKKADTVTNALIDQIITYTSTQKGGNVDTITKEKLDIFLTKEIKRGTNIDTPLKYSINNLTVVNINNEEQFVKYKKEMESILKKYSGLYTETELDIVASALKNDDETILNKLDPYINTYRQFIDALLAIVTPSDIAPIHLKITNGYEKLINSIINMKKGTGDPIRNLIGIAGYRENALKITDSYIELFNKINSKLNPQ